MSDLLRRIPHPVAKIGPCPFCRGGKAELWRNPLERDVPFQVRCDRCGARGPKCDCGWESAVPAWENVARRALDQVKGEGGGGG